MGLKKMEIHKVANMFKSDGTLDHSEVFKALLHFVTQSAGGHYHVEDGAASEVQKAPGRKRITIAFDQVETNTGTKAFPAP